jgi:tRNA(Arg) A34 adenosine deaminase TadA
MIGATMYLVGIDADTGDILPKSEPCMMCRRAIINTRLERVISLQIDLNSTIDMESVTPLYHFIHLENASFNTKEV